VPRCAMTTAPIVSVVIPTRDRAALLPVAIESALAQRVRDVEVIVVDDGSTDDTEAVLARFRDRVRHVRQAPEGVAAARNRGWSEGRGRWIAFLDSDDWWQPEALERALGAAEREPSAGVVSMEARGVRLDGTWSGKSFRKKSPGPWFTTESLLERDAG